METYAITVFVISEEILRILGVTDNPQSLMSNAEIMTFAILSTRYFSSNHKMTRYIVLPIERFLGCLSTGSTIYQLTINVIENFVFSRAEDTPEKANMFFIKFDPSKVAVVATQMRIDRLQSFRTCWNEMKKENWAI